MTVKEVSENLKLAQELFKLSAPPIAQLAKDAFDAIESQKAFIDYIYGLSNCHTCTNKACAFRPKWGTSIRYNCAFYEGPVFSTLN